MRWPTKTCERCQIEWEPSTRYQHARNRFCSVRCATTDTRSRKKWGPEKRPIGTRFWEKVSIGQAEACWEWSGSRCSYGYGNLRAAGRGSALISSHRVSYELNVAPIPAGLNVLHRCDNPPCCNPSHLFLGTHSDNMADMVRKGRNVTPRPPRPEERARGERNGSSKLSEMDVAEIRRRNSAGRINRSATGKEFGVSASTVSAILCGHIWAHSR